MWANPFMRAAGTNQVQTDSIQIILVNLSDQFLSEFL